MLAPFVAFNKPGPLAGIQSYQLCAPAAASLAPPTLREIPLEKVGALVGHAREHQGFRRCTGHRSLPREHRTPRYTQGALSHTPKEETVVSQGLRLLRLLTPGFHPVGPMAPLQHPSQGCVGPGGHHHRTTDQTPHPTAASCPLRSASHGGQHRPESCPKRLIFLGTGCSPQQVNK